MDGPQGSVDPHPLAVYKVRAPLVQIFLPKREVPSASLPCDHIDRDLTWNSRHPGVQYGNSLAAGDFDRAANNGNQGAYSRTLAGAAAVVFQTLASTINGWW